MWVVGNSVWSSGSEVQGTRKKTWGRATVEADQHRRRAAEREREILLVCVFGSFACV